MRHRLFSAVTALALAASVAAPAVFSTAQTSASAATQPVVGEAVQPEVESLESWMPVGLSSGIAAAPSLPMAPVADARRAATGALISGVPVSRKGTKNGSGKTAGYECTAGLPAVKGDREFIVFAGHCGARNETIYTAWNAGTRRAIGKVAGVSKTYDIAAVETTRTVAERVWAVRSGKNKVIRIKGVADAVPGTKVCQHGYRSGTVCGITVQPITDKQKAAGLVYGKAPAKRMAARPGDSGGLVVDSQGRAVGIVSESTEDGVWMAWVPAKLALDNWGLKIK